jgi:putative oxidoreductase
MSRWSDENGGLDFGLLALRLMLATGMGAHGLVRVFGLFGGPGMDSFATVLRDYGFTKQLTPLTWITGVTEVAGSALLVLGLFTPLAAAGLLGVGISVVRAKWAGGFFEGTGQGFELELTLTVIAFALLLTGPGWYAIDRNTAWRRRPLPFAVVGLVLAVGAAVGIGIAF